MLAFIQDTNAVPAVHRPTPALTMPYRQQEQTIQCWRMEFLEKIIVIKKRCFIYGSWFDVTEPYLLSHFNKQGRNSSNQAYSKIQHEDGWTGLISEPSGYFLYEKKCYNLGLECNTITSRCPSYIHTRSTQVLRYLYWWSRPGEIYSWCHWVMDLISHCPLLIQCKVSKKANWKPLHK